MAPLEPLGFALAGYGCTTCIGNSGPLDDAGRGRRRGERPGRRRRAVGQPQLRGPDPSPGARELPRLAAAGRRVRARRPGRHRPDHASRSGTGIGRHAGLPRRHLAGARGDPRGHRPADRPRAVPAHVRDGVRGRRALARAADPVGRPLRLGRRLRRYIAKPPFFDGLDARGRRRSRDIDGRPRAGGARRLGHDRPHLAGRLDRALVARRPVAPGRTASGRSSSTRTARGAATTR